MANKTDLWICGDGISACFHARLLYFFFKANLLVPEGGAFKMHVCVWGWSGYC